MFWNGPYKPAKQTQLDDYSPFLSLSRQEYTPAAMPYRFLL